MWKFILAGILALAALAVVQTRLDARERVINRLVPAWDQVEIIEARQDYPVCNGQQGFHFKAVSSIDGHGFTGVACVSFWSEVRLEGYPSSP